MTFLPELLDSAPVREMVQVFGGYNNNLRIQDGEFVDMKNMSGDSFPILTPRKKRGKLTELTTPNGLFAKSNLFWVDGTSLYHNGALVTGLTLINGAKNFVSMGAYLLIWPDKIYYSTVDKTYGNLGASITIDGLLTCTLVQQDGSEFIDPVSSSSPPEDPEEGIIWLDTSQVPRVLKKYSMVSGSWIPIPTTYIKIGATNIGKQFAEYDGVTISGFSEASLNGGFVLYGAADDYIIIMGIIDDVVTQTGGVTVKREIPDMDFLTESENRVWGCSSTNNEIYACKLGDPKNWRVYMGLASDSYAATVGTDGDFTAAYTHMGQVLFFKEDVLHKIIGNRPASYNITNIACRGVEKGSENSLAIVNERLYYKARTAICMYDGAMPMTISEQLGDVRYTSAVAGAIGNKYYLSMKDASSTYHMFVFDEKLGAWHKEDNTNAKYFTTFEGELFYIDATTKSIMTVSGRLSVKEGGVQYDKEKGGTESDFEWYVETGDIGLSVPENKYVSRLLLRLNKQNDEPLVISLNYDSASEWIEHSKTLNKNLRSFRIPIIPRRCDHMRIKISGKGDCKIYSLSKVVEGGGD